MGAALAAVVGSVLVGVGVGVGTAEEAGPVPVAAAGPVPVLPALPSRAAVRDPAGPSPAPPATEAAPTEEPDPPPAPTAEPTAERAAEPSTAEPTRDGLPSSVPVRAPSAPAPAAPAPAPLAAGTPCTVTARACVDLASRTAWLIEDGAVRRGPVSVQIGDEIDPTPHGTFQVEWKAEQWTSREYLTQMPYSVFFAEGGIAFHEGQQDTNSAGCVKLVHADAVAFFEYLQVGDEVQIR